MSMNPGIPPQKEKADFGLDNPISEGSVTPVSQIIKNTKTYWNSPE